MSGFHRTSADTLFLTADTSKSSGSGNSKVAKPGDRKARSRLSPAAGMVPLFILSATGFLIYSNSFDCSFHYDDVYNIVENKAIRDIGNIGAIWNFLNRRFIGYLSFALDYHFHGLDVFGYHLVNLVIHICASFFVWWLTMLILSTPGMKSSPLGAHRRTAALGCALLFLVHPVQTQAVTYIVQRFASMAAMFYLGAVCFYMKARLTGGRNSTLYFAAAGLSALLGIFTKENVATLPFALILCEIYFFGLSRESTSAAAGNKRILFLAIPSVLFLLIVPALISFDPSMIFGAVESQRFRDPPLTSATYLMTQFRVIVTYIRLLFLPVNQNIDYDFPASRSFLEASTLASFVLLAAILAFAVRIAKRERLMSFGIVWFFLTLSVESSIKPLHNVIFEHRLYLPMYGFSLFFVNLYHNVLWKRNKRVMTGVFIGILLVLSAATYKRNNVYKTETTLWSDAVKKSPNKARALFSLGAALSRAGRTDDARYYYMKALKVYPEYAEVYLNLGNDLLLRGELDEAVERFRKAVEIRPNYMEARSNLAVALTRAKRFREAIEEYQRILEINPDIFEVHKNLGIIYSVRHELSRAARHFEKALELYDGDADTHYLYGDVLLEQKKLREAAEHLHESIRLNPGLAEAYHSLGVCYTLLGEKDKAEEYLKKAHVLLQKKTR